MNLAEDPLLIVNIFYLDIEGTTGPGFRLKGHCVLVAMQHSASYNHCSNSLEFHCMHFGCVCLYISVFYMMLFLWSRAKQISIGAIKGYVMRDRAQMESVLGLTGS